jgi:DNA-binding beta-propeller fold protein YncE
MTRPLILLGALLVGASLPAQDDAVARSQAARTALRRAAQSERAGQLDSAYADVRRAQAAWPEQPAYSETLARWAARRGDTASLGRALDALTAQGTGGATARDTTVRRVASAAADIARRLAALEAALAPVGRGTFRTVLTDSTVWPEGIDADARDGTLFVTSLRRRDVLVVASSGATRWLLRAPMPRPSAIFGIVVDAARDVAWLTAGGHRAMEGYVDADSASSELLRVGLRDGRIQRRWRLGDGTGLPGEIGLAPDGEVVVSDAVLGRLYRLRQGADSLETIAHPLLRSPQGIAFSPDGRTAWVADWSHGLLRWDRGSGALAVVAVHGGGTLLGIDGLRRVGDRLVGVQNGVAPARVIGVALSTDGARATAIEVLDRPAQATGEPTVGTVVGDRFVYIASSQWPFWSDDVRRLGTMPLPSVTLREFSLRP